MPLGDIDAFVSTSLFASVKDLYPDHDLYVACKDDIRSVFDANDYVHKTLTYEESFNNVKLLKCKDGKNLFEVVYTPHLNKNNFQQIAKTNC